MNLINNILSFILKSSNETPILYKENTFQDNEVSIGEKTLGKNLEKKEDKINPLISNNYIKITKNNKKNKYHDFYILEFVNDSQFIIKEEEVLNCLLCTIDYGKSVNYIIGKNYNFEQNEIFKEFAEPLKNYFLIFVKGVDVSDTLKNCTIIDPYDFYTIAIKDGKEIDKKSYRTLDAPLINSKGELFWQPTYSDFNDGVITIDDNQYLNVPNMYAAISLLKLVNKCNIYDENFIKIYFFRKNCLPFYMIYELCKTADSLEIIQNKFDDDIDTVNYCAKFYKNRIDDIAFVYYCLDKRNGHTAYFNNLYSSSGNKIGCSGTAIYGIPYSEYLKGLNWTMNYQAQFILSDEQKYNFKKLVKHVYDKYSSNNDFIHFPEEFNNGLILEDDFLDELKIFVENNYYKQIPNDNKAEAKKIQEYNKNKKDILKEKYQELKSYLVKNDVYSPKWKSEIELFKLVSDCYSRAIYQYQADWLGTQSLDIYIPEKNIAFEYQGQQHYEPIDFWGGQEGFKKRQLLDEQKRQLCRENEVRLIEWRYDEPISKIILENKLKAINIDK